MKTKTKVCFRNRPKEMSADDVKKMLKEKDFFDVYYNGKGRGFENQFQEMMLKGEKVIIDQASGLMWQQSGSDASIIFEAAEVYIKELNKQQFAGFNDWRLPTLEEAMSLMEPKKHLSGLYIDKRFDSKQKWIWTSDSVKGESWEWVVLFNGGYCYGYQFSLSGYHVRALRSEQSSGGGIRLI